MKAMLVNGRFCTIRAGDVTVQSDDRSGLTFVVSVFRDVTLGEDRAVILRLLANSWVDLGPVVVRNTNSTWFANERFLWNER